MTKRKTQTPAIPKDYEKFLIALPADLKRWCEEQAELAYRSRNAQIICTLQKMRQLEQQQRA